MYGYFRKIAGPRTAGLICAVWYAALIVAILLASVEPPADFRYGRY
jgi:hypothetical protein